MSNNNDSKNSNSRKELIYDNLSPSDEELRAFAYSTLYTGVEQDWEICAVDFRQRHLYLEFASDPHCPFSSLFTNMLFVLAASLVYEVPSRPTCFGSSEAETISSPSIASSRTPLSTEIREKLLLLLNDLEQASKPEIVFLRQSIRDNLLNDNCMFNYDFWFSWLWKENLQGQLTPKVDTL